MLPTLQTANIYMPKTKMMLATPPEGSTAALILADGSVFWGRGIGATGNAVGEVCFNTSITGYQEILTDPSYARQLVTLTYPHIVNTGTNAEDAESRGVFAAGLVIRDLPPTFSNFRARESLPDFLQRRSYVGAVDACDLATLASSTDDDFGRLPKSCIRNTVRPQVRSSQLARLRVQPVRPTYSRPESDPSLSWTSSGTAWRSPW